MYVSVCVCDLMHWNCQGIVNIQDSSYQVEKYDIQNIYQHM